MKKLLLQNLFFLFLLISLVSYGQTISEEQKKAIETFITYVETGGWASLSEVIIYPV